MSTQPDPRMSRGLRDPSEVRFWIGRVDFVLFLLLWLSYAYFYQSSQHNEAARFDQIRAVLEDGTFAIDRFAYNTADVIQHVKGGVKHIYPAKAPGLTFIGVVPFRLASFTLQPFSLPAALHWPATQRMQSERHRG